MEHRKLFKKEELSKMELKALTKMDLETKPSVIHYFKRLSYEKDCQYFVGIYVTDDGYHQEKSISDIVVAGNCEKYEARDLILDICNDNLNGIMIDGGCYKICGITAHLSGNGDDGIGVGAAIFACGDAKVEIENAVIRTEGYSRSALAVMDHAEVWLKHCRLHAEGLEFEKNMEENNPPEPPWQIGLRGNCRTTTLDDYGVVHYDDCYVSARNWGVLSVDDDSAATHIYAKNSCFEVTGTNGYGCFTINCVVSPNYEEIGEYGSFHVFDHCYLFVPTYVMYMSVGKTGAEYTNGTVIESKQYGICAFRSSGGLIQIRNKTVFRTGLAAFIVKGSSVTIEIENSYFYPKNNVILQLMDNDDPGQLCNQFDIPLEDETRDESRDLTCACKKEDVFLRITKANLEGDLFNATTNRVERRLPEPENAEVPPNFIHVRGMRGKDLQGAKNLEVRLQDSTLTGIISSAKASYRENLTVIDKSNCEEMSNVVCKVAEPINNGVILILDGRSIWRVTETSYLTCLRLEKGAVIEGIQETSIRFFVNEKETVLEEDHTYEGILRIEPFKIKNTGREEK